MAGTLVIDTLKSSTANPTAFVNTSGVEVGQLCKAWVNFNGTTGAIRTSFNVSSVTRLATGRYQVNFTNAFADVNYSVAGQASVDGTVGVSGTPRLIGAEGTATMLTGSCIIGSHTTRDVPSDAVVMTASFFR